MLIVFHSIAGVIWNRYLPQKLEQYLPADAVSDAPNIFASFVYAMEFPEGEPTREAINRSYRETTKILAISATSIMAGMLMIQLLLKNINLAEADVKREEQLATADGFALENISSSHQAATADNVQQATQSKS